MTVPWDYIDSMKDQADEAEAKAEYDKKLQKRYQELEFAASEVVTAYDSNESLGDWAARLENCMAILRELVK